MIDERIEQAAYEIYREFIRHGIGSCMVVSVRGVAMPETPEQAVARRWKRLPENVRAQFVAEAIATDPIN